jgi:ATP adenylyltransferase
LPDHDKIWAPWRIYYIKNELATRDAREAALPPGVDPNCFICRGLAQDDDRANLIVARGQHCAVLMNRFPYNNGHLLVAPLGHKGGLEDLSDVELLECQHLIVRFMAILREQVSAQGFNVGLNLGRIAGAGLPGHLHWHIVPRWAGDTNFMPVLASVDVIHQSLDSLWDLLHEAYAKKYGGA